LFNNFIILKNIIKKEAKKRAGNLSYLLVVGTTSSPTQKMKNKTKPTRVAFSNSRPTRELLNSTKVKLNFLFSQLNERRFR